MSRKHYNSNKISISVKFLLHFFQSTRYSAREKPRRARGAWQSNVLTRGQWPREKPRKARGAWQFRVLTRGQWPRGKPRRARGGWQSRVLTRGQWPREKKSLRRGCGAGILEMEVGGALLSRAPGRSIIAAGALNGRVRDGNGCLSPAKATNQKDWARRTLKMKALHGAFPPRGGMMSPRGGRRASHTAYQNASAERVAALAPCACRPGSLPGAFRGLRLG